MEYSIVREKVKAELSDIAKISIKKIKGTFSLLKDLRLDSLDIIDLECRLEDIFDIRIPENYLERCEKKKSICKSQNYFPDISVNQLTFYIFNLISSKSETCSN